MKKRLPHLILFNPDQWRGDVLGHAGNPAARTPHLDAFVETDAVSMGGAFCQNPVCVPSRCSFMTGLYPHVRGQRTMSNMIHSERGESHLLQVLREQGYLLWWGGKNDLFPGPQTRGGATEVDFRYPHSSPELRAPGQALRPNPHIDTSWRPAPGESGFYAMLQGRLGAGGEPPCIDGDEAIIRKACEFIQAYDGERPLCMLLALEYPHPPYGAEEPCFSAIDRHALPPQIPAPVSPASKPAILDRIRQNQDLGDWTEDQWNELRATYYASCMRLDEQFGRVMEALRRRELFDDTAVFFVSDHGDFTGDYGLVEKNQNTFEDCLTRVPFVIKPPKDTEVRPGYRAEALAELVDLPATIYDLLGIDPGYDHFGRSLLPLVAGKTDEHRDAVFCEGGRRPGEIQASETAGTPHDRNGLYWPRMDAQHSESPFLHNQATMCRTRDWKYVRRQGESDELYDLRADPGETINRIDDPTCADTLNALRLRLLDWLQQTADVVPRTPDRR
jgi:arylsulfatase A-like enzyme